MKIHPAHRATALCLMLPLLLTSCVMFAPKDRGREELPLPRAFTLYEETAPAPALWWQSFGSDELDQLVSRALVDNLSLQQVYARLRQAEMMTIQARAVRFPTLDASGETSVTRTHIDTGVSPNKWDVASQKIGALETIVANPGVGTAPTSIQEGVAATMANLQTTRTKLQALDTFFTAPPSSESTINTESYRFGLGSSYEVDLWGRVRAQHKAANLDFEASKEDLYAAKLSLSGTVAIRWLDMVAHRQELTLVTKQLELNKTTLELINFRFRRGKANGLDVFQQRQIVAQTESLFPPLESGLQTAQHELAVLLGEQPRADLGVAAETLPDVGALPVPGVPADLLANRPDVRARGRVLRAADWRVGAARADRLPALRLSGSASYGADEWDLVFDNWMATLAGSVTGPIFDAGRRKAEVARTRAVVDERLAGYRESVLVAVKEVENAMLQETKQAEYVDALRRELDAARAAHERALDRYLNGQPDYLPVLSALSQLQVLERRIVGAELNRLNRRIQLCIALGGAWMNDESLEGGETVADNRHAVN
ncbi:MAG: efflux transporter outer membrane subunit [bacterium]|nr:efflux transporter outer membrane subunit [bacterium]